MKKIFFIIVIVLFVFGALNVIAQDSKSGSDSSGSGSSDSSEIDSKAGSGGSGSSDSMEKGIPPTVAREEIKERVRDNLGNEVRTEVKREIKGDKEKLRSLLEEKLRNTPAEERNRILKITQNVEGVESFINGLSPEEAKKFALLDRTKQIEIAKERRIEELRKIKLMQVGDEEFKAREVVREKIKTSVENFKEARGKTQEIREELKNTREELKNAQTNEEKLAVGKEHLSKIIDSELTELNALKERIQNNQDINTEESSDSTERVDSAISSLELLKTKIADATSIEQLRSLGNEIKKYTLVKHVFKTRAVAANICHGVLLRSELLERKAELALSKAEDSGADTTELNARIEKLNSLLESARAQCSDAKSAFDSAKNIDNVEEKKELTKKFIESTKQAYEKVKEAGTVVKEIREIVSKLSINLDKQEVTEITIEEDN